MTSSVYSSITRSTSLALIAFVQRSSHPRISCAAARPPAAGGEFSVCAFVVTDGSNTATLKIKTVNAFIRLFVIDDHETRCDSNFQKALLVTSSLACQAVALAKAGHSSL